MNLCAQKVGENESWKELFLIEFQLLSILMCRKHKTQMLRFHSPITPFNCARKFAAAVWTSILIVFVLPCNWIFFIGPFHDLLLFVWWQLRKINSTLSLLIYYVNTMSTSREILFFPPLASEHVLKNWTFIYFCTF